MDILRRDFLKYCAGSAAALGLEFSALGKVLAARGVSYVPTYPISTTINSTLVQTVIPANLPKLGVPYGPGAQIWPSDIEDYAAQGYGLWNPDGPAFPYLLPDMNNPPNPNNGYVIPTSSGPSGTTLLTFFTISDVHICDKESPARAIYTAYQYPEPRVTNPLTGALQPAVGSSFYSGIILNTTHVLDAAVQTINALHQVTPFDFGIGLGDACDSNQYNELRWYIDVIDGKMITPSSGAHLGSYGPDSINYQRPYQAAGLDKSIKWYQAIGNHDQLWMGSTPANNYIRKTLVGSKVLDLGQIVLQPPFYLTPDWNQIKKTRGFYMGVVDGATQYGTIIYAGADTMPTPKVHADPKRHSVSPSAWMREFFNTTSKPVGHGFTQEMIAEGFACYHFYPKADLPIKVIVLDDTDKTGTMFGALDNKRYKWLIKELDAGQKANQLMIVCCHIPVHPYALANPIPSESDPNPAYDYLTIWTDPTAFEGISEMQLLATLHNYPNMILWISGHVHRNTITPQPYGDPANGIGFWEVETPSLRDYPQQFRHFQIVCNDEGNISIFVHSVDPAVNPAFVNGSSPAYTSREYSLATQQIFGNPWQMGPGMVLSDPSNLLGPNDPSSNGVYNAELVIQLSQLTPGLQAKMRAFSG